VSGVARAFVGLMCRLMLRHLARPGGVTGVILRGRALSRRVSGMRPLCGRGGSVPAMGGVTLLSGSCTRSGAVSRVCPGSGCCVGLSMCGVIASRGRNSGSWRVPGVRTVILPTRATCRCRESAVTRVSLAAGGGSAMAGMRGPRRSGSRGRSMAGMRIIRLRRGSVPGVRIGGAAMSRMRVGCRSVSGVGITGIRDSEVSRRVRKRGSRRRLGAIRRAARRQREARKHRNGER
jgi:hypothetical protein